MLNGPSPLRPRRTYTLDAQEIIGNGLFVLFPIQVELARLSGNSYYSKNGDLVKSGVIQGDMCVMDIPSWFSENRMT